MSGGEILGLYTLNTTFWGEVMVHDKKKKTLRRPEPSRQKKASKQHPAARPVPLGASVCGGRGSFWPDAHLKWFPTWRRE